MPLRLPSFHWHNVFRLPMHGSHMVNGTPLSAFRLTHVHNCKERGSGGTQRNTRSHNAHLIKTTSKTKPHKNEKKKRNKKEKKKEKKRKKKNTKEKKRTAVLILAWIASLLVFKIRR
jgi:chemotaxis response regulator CheB